VTGPVDGDDGLPRCPWGDAPEDYRAYHDLEWGRAVRGDSAIFERLSLEGFQAGLSWLTILRKREAFRDAFAGFDIAVVAAFDRSDIDRLAVDARLIRHRAKVEAVVGNAQLVQRWQEDEGEGVLDALVWSCASAGPAPRTMADVPTKTPESERLSRSLRERGWHFIGPTSAYAALQAMGVVDDHLAGCHARGGATRSSGPAPDRR
jgi:DNA-3-methyladenine glycosylase I